MAHSARARSGMMLTPMPPSMRPVLTVMCHKFSAFLSFASASDTTFASTMVHATTAGSESATSWYPSGEDRET